MVETKAGATQGTTQGTKIFNPRSPSPLKLLVALYLKAEDDCYINYMEGATAIITAYAPWEAPPTTLPPVPRVFRTYELNELSGLLASNKKLPNFMDSLDLREAYIRALYQEFKRALAYV